MVNLADGNGPFPQRTKKAEARHHSHLDDAVWQLVAVVGLTGEVRGK